MLNSVRRAGSTLGLLVVFVFLLEESVCIAGQEVQGYYNQDSDPYVPTVKTATTCATEYEVQVTACNTQVQAGASMCAVDQANLYSESTFATLSCCNTTVASTSQCPTDTSSYGNKQLSEMILEKEAVSLNFHLTSLHLTNVRELTVSSICSTSRILLQTQGPASMDGALVWRPAIFSALTSLARPTSDLRLSAPSALAACQTVQEQRTATQES